MSSVEAKLDTPSFLYILVLTRHHVQPVCSFEVRRLAVEAFIRLIHPTLKYSIAKIEDM